MPVLTGLALLLAKPCATRGPRTPLLCWGVASWLFNPSADSWASVSSAAHPHSNVDTSRNLTLIPGPALLLCRRGRTASLLLLRAVRSSRTINRLQKGGQPPEALQKELWQIRPDQLNKCLKWSRCAGESRLGAHGTL